MNSNDLVSSGLLQPHQLHLLEMQRDRLLRIGTRRSIGELAVENGFVKSSQIQDGAHSTTRDLIDVRLAHSLTLMPVYIRDNILTVRCARQLKLFDKKRVIDNARLINGSVQDVEFTPGNIEEIMGWLRKRQAISQSDLTDKVEALNVEANNPVLIQSVLEGLFNLAIVRGSSDIHLRKHTNGQNQNAIELRIDGQLRPLFLLSFDAMSAIFARVKGLANLDISNAYVPQDGRTQMEFKGRKIDMRVATIPSIDGEKITIRMLDPDNLISLDEMFGIYPKLLRDVKRLTDVTPGLGGMVIVSGPTGSGKTTTNYALIREIDRVSLNVMSAEDPVEYEMPLMTQSQVRPEAGVDFPHLLRAQLRNDPDVLLVGEMRDADTAEIAVRSADTGHAIFTTLHTDDAISTVNRFLSMLTPEFAPIGRKALANNLKAIINQRLSRKLCSCAVPATEKDIDESMSEYFTVAHENLRVAVGCPICERTGYKGRVMVPEAIFFKSKKIAGPEVGEAIESGSISQSFIEKSDAVIYHSLRGTCEQLLNSGLIDYAEAKKILGINS